MVRQHHQLNGHEFEQTLGNSEDREAWRAAVHGVRVRHDLATEQQQGSGTHYMTLSRSFF